MKNNFLSLVTKMPQNTGGGNSQTKRATLALPLRYLCAMLFAFILAIGNVWADEWTAAEIAKKDGSVNVGTTKNHLTVSSPGVTSVTNAKYAKISGSEVKRDGVEINGAATSGSLVETNILSIKTDRGYKLVSPVKVNGHSSSTTEVKAAYVGWEGQPTNTFTLCNGATEWKFQKNSATTEPADNEITFSTTIRSIYIYKQIKTATDAYNSFGTSKTVGNNTKFYIASVTASAVLAPEIEGESQMFNDETISLVGYPAGGTWGVKAGDPGTITADGKLTATGNGTIHVTYTVDEVEETKEIVAAATKTLVWNFDTKDVLPTTAGITATNVGGTFETAGQLKLDNGAYVAIDLTSKDYIITAASINARTGSDSKLINFGSALSTTADGNVNSSNSYADIAITPVKSSSIFSLSKNNSGVYVAKITLTVKKAVACTVAPTVSATTKGATTSTTQVVNCAGISSLGSEGCSISSYGFVYGTGETPNIDDDTPVEVGTSYSTINTAFAETTLTGLTPSTTYYVRAYATNGFGTAYGSAVSFTTSAACTVAPTVSTISKGTTSYTTQVMNCAGITSLGSAGCAISSYGFVYGTSEHPTTANTTKEVGTSYTVVETAFAETTLTGLTPNTTYYVRAYATNDFGTAYSSNELSFTTLPTIGNVAFIASSSSVTNDAITALQGAGYNVTVRAKEASPDYTGVDLVVLDESLSWANSDEGATVVGVNVPILNLKAFFYTLSSRWNWGTPVNPSTSELATLSTEYTNISSHPIFDGVTITAGAVDMVNPSKSGNNLQGVTTNTLVEGKEGYTLATSATGVTCIHELTPAQRGVSTAKYLLIALSSNIKDNYSDDAKKMIVNAAKYLIGSTPWEPVVAPTSPVVTATPSAAYLVGDDITLTASATGTSATTTYTWYKGDSWAEAEAAGAIKAAATAAAGGNTYTKNDCATSDAGTYWCVISNGVGAEASASLAVTVSDASYNITFVSAHGTAPTATTGVAYTLPELTESGWAHQGWTASIDVTVDAAMVDAGTLIANDKVASFADDVTFTAVWKQEFQVTFNLKGHGDPIAPQVVVDGELATDPGDPAELGYDFGGWFTNEECTAGNEFSFSTPITATTPLYAKWTAFDGCTLLVPATSGDAPAVGDPISMQTGSKGGSMSVVGTPLSYNAYGLSFESSSSAKAKVTINNEIQEGTVISLTLVANGTSAPRGLHLYTGDGATKIESLGWTSEVVKYTEATFTYTVQSTDVALIGTNEFQLWRNGSVFLKKLTVTNCGDAITFHNLTSAVNIAGKGTVTLGASSVREGYTTTATYSDIDPLYEFVNWTVSGAGASIADASANPATITMGTEDAVVTLNLQVKPVYYTVTYYDGASEMGTEQVAENGHPSATGITTKKLGYNFLGWSETDGGAVVNLNDISITDAKNLYAKYEAVVCPTSGTVYKFQLKTDLTSGNVFDTKPNSVAFTTDNYLSVLTGGILTGSIDNNNVNRLQFFDNKAVGFNSGSGGTLTIGLDCELAEGDVIKYINYANSGNRMTLSDATHTQTLDGNGTEEVQTWDVPAAWAGATELTLVRGGNTPKLTYFEIYRRPVATGATLADLTIRQGQSKTPVMTLEPSADARVTSQVWEIVGTPTNLTGAAINPATGAITTGTLDDPTSTGSISVKVTLNGSIEATCTATVVGNIAQQDVTKSTIWDWHNTGATANIQLTNDTDPKKNENFVLANVAVNNNDEFESDKLAVEGEHMVRDYDKTNPYFQGQLIQFHTTVAGVVRVKFAHTGNATAEKPARELYINGVATGDSRDNATPEWSNYIEVPAGDVSITAYYVNLLPVAAQQYIRVFEIEFFAYDTERNDSWIAPGELGTICYPNGHIITGAEVYEMAGVDENNKFVFDQVEKTEPGKPYLFVATSNEPIKLYKTTAAAEVSPIANNGMIGTFVSIDLDYTDERAAKWYYFSGKKFYAVSKRTDNLNVPANRAYVDMNTPVPAGAPRHGVRRITFDVQGANVATGLENGELMNDAMVKKVLINGQLFILRGEKMYDAKGQLVK